MDQNEGNQDHQDRDDNDKIYESLNHDENKSLYTKEEMKKIIRDTIRTTIEQQLSHEEIAKILKEYTGLTDTELTAIKKAVHEEARVKEAAFLLDQRNGLKKWGPVAMPYYWARSKAPDYDLMSLFLRSVVIGGVTSVGIAIMSSVIMDQYNRTELGDIKAESDRTVIHSGSYHKEIGLGPYNHLSNSLSEGFDSKGRPGYGYNGPGGAYYNIGTLVENGNEKHVSFSEPAVFEALSETSPFTDNHLESISDYVTLIKKLDIKECAWSVSPNYTHYQDIIQDLEDGKTITMAKPWGGKGSDHSGQAILNTLLANYRDQIEFIEVTDNIEMLEKLENQQLDLAVFNEAAGTFDGKLVGTFLKVALNDKIQLVNMPIDSSITRLESSNDYTYRFQSLNVPQSAYPWLERPKNRETINTICNDYIGVYGRNPNSIKYKSLASDVNRIHANVQAIDIVGRSEFEGFNELALKKPVKPKELITPIKTEAAPAPPPSI